MNTCSPTQQRFIGFGLMAFMLATRFHHFGDALHLPDASWAIFFIAGFYLSPLWLAGLMVEAVAIDAVAEGWMGVSAYCLTPAYGFLLAAYGALWQGGRWLRTRQHLAALIGAASVSIFTAFAISNAGFYWLGGQIAEPTWTEFGAQFVRYLPLYVAATGLYLAVAALAHVLLTQRTAMHQKSE